MKTPRLALFAFLALALAPLAPLANAALPAWTVVEEGPRSWARVFFTVGKENKTLRCRYAECKPERKTVSDLYIIAPVGKATPTKVTIYKMVPRSKWNPKYYTDGPYDKVPEVINANAQPYSSELSNFKLDNTGAKLMVVQGDKKFPASTDINEAQFNSYDQMKVSPPAKMADDVLKPDAPAAGPENGGRRGRGGNGGSGDAAKKWWCDPKTGDKYSAVHGRKGSTLLASKDAVCKKKGGSTPNPVVTKPPVESAVTLALVAEETRWLTKDQQDAYDLLRKNAKDDAARKAADAKYRAFIEAQIRPEAAAAYKAAHAAPVAEAAVKIKAAIGGVEMWGGEIKAVVPPFVEKPEGKILEVTLSKAEYDALKAKPNDLEAYKIASTPANGESDLRRDGSTGPGRVFNEDKLDQVGLHLAVVAARNALGATTPAKAPRSILTPEEIALLTPKEKEMYDGFLERAKKDGKFDPTDNNLLTNAELLRNRMNNEVPKRSAAAAAPPSENMTAEQFAKLPLFQQRQFCKDYPPDPVTLQNDSRAKGLDTGPDALKGAQNSVPGAVTQTKPAAPPAKDTAWPRKARQDACAKLPSEIPGQIDGTAGTGGKPSVGTNVPVPPGTDAENKAKEKSKWLTQDLLTSAAKGAMVGLLVGSLFGPAGLILGPLIGGALFYGLTKITS